MINIHDLPQKREIVEMSEVEISQTSGGDSSTLSFLLSVADERAEDYLMDMANLGSRMGPVSGDDRYPDDPDYTHLFDRLTPAEMQIIKTYQVALSTKIKSIGEELSNVARKS